MLTKKEKATELVNDLRKLGVTRIATGTHPNGVEEVVTSFGNLSFNNVDDTQLNFTITDSGFVLFLGPLYKCNDDNFGTALVVVNVLNQDAKNETFFIDENRCINMKSGEYFIEDHQMRSAFISRFSEFMNEDFFKIFKNHL